MLSSPVVYDALQSWIRALGIAPHQASARALAQRLTAVLTAQTLTPADLQRTLLSAPTVPARQRYRRLARTWAMATLTSGWLTPALVRAALTLARPLAPVLALDSVRCGAWEVLTVGLVWHRRVLLLGWAVLPYPMPHGAFTPAVGALLRQVAAAWPHDQPVPHLVADRGFPSTPLFATLTALGWEFTIRLRATDWLRQGETRQPVRAVLAAADPGQWTRTPGVQFGQGPAAALVVGRGLPVLAWHQRDDGSARARQRRAARRLHDLHSKHPRQRPDAAQATDRWAVFLSTAPTARAAVCCYARRWSIEGSYRDGQSGYDGRHGWNLEPLVAQQTAAGAVAAIVGLWALALLVQSWVGDAIGQATVPLAVQQVVRQWTTSGRLSVFMRGRLAWLDRSGDLAAWLAATLAAGAARLAVAPPACGPSRPRKAAA